MIKELSKEARALLMHGMNRNCRVNSVIVMYTTASSNNTIVTTRASLAIRSPPIPIADSHANAWIISRCARYSHASLTRCVLPAKSSNLDHGIADERPYVELHDVLALCHIETCARARRQRGEITFQAIIIAIECRPIWNRIFSTSWCTCGKS